MAVLHCNTTSDCVGYDGGFGKVVYKKCYEAVAWSEEENFCECSSWYGYTGDACDQESVNTKYIKSLYLIFILYAVLMSGLLIYILSWKLRAVAIETHWKPLKVIKNLGPNFIVGVSCLLAYSISLVYTVPMFRGATDPSRFEVVSYEYILRGPTEELTVTNGDVGVSYLGVANACFILGAMQMSLSWLDIAKSCWAIFEPKMKDRAEKFGKFMRVASWLYVLSSLICIIAQIVFGVMLITVGMIVMLIVLFIAARIAFIRAVKSVQTIGPELEEAIRIVKYSSLVHILCLSTIFILLLLYFTLIPSHESNLEPGDFNYVLCFRDTAILIVAFMGTSETIYIWNNISRSSRSTINSHKATKTMTHGIKQQSNTSLSDVNLYEIPNSSNKNISKITI